MLHNFLVYMGMFYRVKLIDMQFVITVDVSFS